MLLALPLLLLLAAATFWFRRQIQIPNTKLDVSPCARMHRSAPVSSAAEPGTHPLDCEPLLLGLLNDLKGATNDTVQKRRGTPCGGETHPSTHVSSRAGVRACVLSACKASENNGRVGADDSPQTRARKTQIQVRQGFRKHH